MYLLTIFVSFGNVNFVLYQMLLKNTRMSNIETRGINPPPPGNLEVIRSWFPMKTYMEIFVTQLSVKFV